VRVCGQKKALVSQESTRAAIPQKDANEAPRPARATTPREELVILAAAESESGRLRHPRAPISGWIMGSMGGKGGLANWQ